MADLNALYSYQGQEPRPLPHEIFYTESWGGTNFRQGVESFTDEEIQRAGYTGPYTRPDFNFQIETQEWNTDLKDWVIKSLFFPDEVFWDRLRGERNYRLAKTDWTQLEDSQLSSVKKTEWAFYRQELRDIPKNTEDPNNITWPTEPN